MYDQDQKKEEPRYAKMVDSIVNDLLGFSWEEQIHFMLTLNVRLSDVRREAIEKNSCQIKQLGEVNEVIDKGNHYLQQGSPVKSSSY